MTDEQRRPADVERDEAWLGRIMPPDACPSLERIKHRVQLAVHEAWFAKQVDDERSGPDLEGLKSAVHRSLTARLESRSRVSSASPPVSGGRWFRPLAGLAAAAVVVLSTTLVLRQGRTGVTETRLPPSGRIDDLIAALDAESYPSASDWEELAWVDEEIVRLEESMADTTWSDWNEWVFEDMGDALDALSDQLG